MEIALSKDTVLQLDSIIAALRRAAFENTPALRLVALNMFVFGLRQVLQDKNVIKFAVPIKLFASSCAIAVFPRSISILQNRKKAELVEPFPPLMSQHNTSFLTRNGRKNGPFSGIRQMLQNFKITEAKLPKAN
jgi:hypothetical protein